MPEELRVMPHNIEVEAALIGAILSQNRVFTHVSDFLEPEHFFEPAYGWLYMTMAGWIDGGKKVSPVTIRHLIDGNAMFAQVGDDSYAGNEGQILYELATGTVSVLNARDYGQTIHALHQDRVALGIYEDAANEIYEGTAHDGSSSRVEDVIDGLSALVETDSDGGGLRHIADIAEEAVLEIDKDMRGESPVGVSTGITDLDKTMPGFMPGDLTILAARPGMGKSQTLDCLIKTPDGWTTMGDVKVGDRLASHDGRPSQVEGVFERGEREVFRITFSDGRSTRACADHLWTVHNRKWQESRTISTQQIGDLLQKPGYRNRIWVDRVSGNFGHEEHLPVDPWFLGTIIGNGNLTDGTVRFSTSDAETLWRVTKCADECGMKLTFAGAYDYRIINKEGSHQKGTQGVVPSPLMEKLKRLGLAEKRSEGKFIPDVYLNAGKESRLELLRGLMDTDGWVEKSGSLRYSTSSGRLADNVSDLVRSLGGLCSIKIKHPIYTYKGGRKNGLLHFHCNIRHVDPKSLVRLHRKRERARQSNCPRLNVVSVVPDGNDHTRCIKVSHPDGLYITDDYIVTHNTALAGNITEYAAANHGPVAFFSLEMRDLQLARRQMAALARVDSKLLFGRNAQQMSMDQFAAIQATVERCRNLPVYIDDTAYLTVAALTARAKRMQRREGLGLIVVDYLQLVRATTEDRRKNNKVAEISGISAALKATAKSLDVPVLALSQLSRNVESRTDKRPMLSDLRDSGSIEQDADNVLFLYREEYYLQVALRGHNPGTTAYANAKDRLEEVEGKGEIILSKQRNGPVGVVNVKWEGEYQRFSDPTPNRHSDDEIDTRLL